MFSEKTANSIAADLVDMHEHGLFADDLDDNRDLIGVDLLTCTEDQQNRALALHQRHIATLQAVRDGEVQV